jgi:hypothetical protein
LELQVQVAAHHVGPPVAAGSKNIVTSDDQHAVQ